ncbi:Uncharacterized protein TCM_018244 [Theobroma cacao]|uniref:Uncharacterized protein n=1 Tax=Theobroma cacao TaxID=3641 RepID=A0A061EG22_THECC|nr:Uncharacterized protein TCM_018244 [Theobroma cacao]
MNNSKEKGNDSDSTKEGSMESTARSHFVQGCHTVSKEDYVNEQQGENDVDDLESDQSMSTSSDSDSSE